MANGETVKHSDRCAMWRHLDADPQRCDCHVGEIAALKKELADREQVIKDAVMLIRRMLNAGLNKPLTAGLHALVVDWISRKGLSGSPLRTRRTAEVSPREE